ncbi:MAG: DNA polymerase III subunit gamma/tau [Phycisphaeraceae bacterium]|nr:DNA polymerase III subunit gamma/tau [Phycisphaeraceae bacterium]
MAYTVLARRYRSQEFDELIGQEPIARTLGAAIKAGRVAHAYLFCGTRGVGKTSMARLFAKALNGRPDAGSDDPVNKAIMTGQDTDVIEIDAASNRGVDEARDLIANSIYRPLRGPYKVYIIDEVHMLTREAFNALLKTMEEPPEHVKFILCTTEAHKVPATIQSRCQRFDFRPIPTDLIASHLRTVLAGEGVAAEPDVVRAIARLGNGSMRDALSILDRLLATGSRSIGLRLLEELVGLPDRDLVSAVLDAVASGDAGGALDATDSLLTAGVTIEQALESLAARFHDMLLLRACGEGTQLVDLTDEHRTEEITRAGAFDEAALTYMIAQCETVQRQVRYSALPRALLDATVVRLAQAERFADAVAVMREMASGEGRAAPKKR